MISGTARRALLIGSHDEYDLLMTPPSNELLQVGAWWARNRNADIKSFKRSMCLRLIRRISLAQCSVPFKVVSE